MIQTVNGSKQKWRWSHIHYQMCKKNNNIIWTYTHSDSGVISYNEVIPFGFSLNNIVRSNLAGKKIVINLNVTSTATIRLTTSSIFPSTIDFVDSLTFDERVLTDNITSPYCLNQWTTQQLTEVDPNNGTTTGETASITVLTSGNNHSIIIENYSGSFDFDEFLFQYCLQSVSLGARKSINICSLGFDARVGIDVHKYTQNPFISGTMGYVVSLLSHFIKGINRPLKIKLDGKELMGEFALVCACNGRYYGGGFNPVPEAEPDDGLMDVLIVKQVSRLTFLKLIGKYAKGRYAELSKYISHYRCTEIAFESDEELGINVDGEAVFSKTPAFRMEPGAVNFIFPEGAAFLSSRNS